ERGPRRGDHHAVVRPHPRQRPAGRRRPGGEPARAAHDARRRRRGRVGPGGDPQQLDDGQRHRGRRWRRSDDVSRPTGATGRTTGLWREAAAAVRAVWFGVGVAWQVYHPAPRPLQETPDARGLEFESWSWRTHRDRLDIQGWFVEGTGPDA